MLIVTEADTVRIIYIRELILILRNYYTIVYVGMMFSPGKPKPLL